MPTGSYEHPLLGHVEFETKTKDRWVRGDDITFTKGFTGSDVRKVVVPQLKYIKNGGLIRFHLRGHPQLFGGVCGSGIGRPAL